MSNGNNENDHEEKKPKFRVVDRRRLDSEAEEEPEVEKTVPEPEEPVKEPEQEKPDSEAKTGMDGEASEGMDEATEEPFGYLNILISFIQTIAALSWIHFGLDPDPKTSIIDMEKDQAKKISDLYELFLKEIKDELPENIKKELGSRLVYRNLIFSFLQTLGNISWIHLGLVPNPQTKIIAKNIEEARKTVNLFELILEQARPALAPEQVVELEKHLGDLKANYINQL